MFGKRCLLLYFQWILPSLLLNALLDTRIVTLLPHAISLGEIPRTLGVAESVSSNPQPASASQPACRPFAASETVSFSEYCAPSGGVGSTRQRTEEALAEIREQPSCLGLGFRAPSRVTVRFWKAEVGKPCPWRVSTVPPAGHQH